METRLTQTLRSIIINHQYVEEKQIVVRISFQEKHICYEIYKDVKIGNERNWQNKNVAEVIFEPIEQGWELAWYEHLTCNPEVVVSIPTSAKCSLLVSFIHITSNHSHHLDPQFCCCCCFVVSKIVVELSVSNKIYSFYSCNGFLLYKTTTSCSLGNILLK